MKLIEIHALIAERYEKRFRELTEGTMNPEARITTMMDLDAVAKQWPHFRWLGLLSATSFEFMHDMMGIKRHINRETGLVDGRFLPRFASDPWSDQFLPQTIEQRIEQ